MKEKQFLIKTIWQYKWCKLEDNWSLHQWQKYFYTIKAIICIMLNREWKNTQWNWYDKDYITVGMHSFNSFYNYYVGGQDANFTDITIGYGVFTNWYYFEMDDGWL